MSKVATPNGKKAAPRRQQVRDLLARGLTIRQIATVMGITTQGVYDHVAGIEREDAAKERAS
jgi:DNA-binding NarL/FixJ family response regulator